MRLLVLNPNSTRAMTDAVAASAAALVPDGVRVAGWTAAHGPAVIADRPSYDAAASAMPALLAQAPPADAILLACFGDPGLAFLRSRAGVPVVGLAEAAIVHALRLRQPFAIITAGAGWVPLLEERVQAYGALEWLTGVFALGGDGAALRADPERFRGEVLELAWQARQRGARRIILGGAAFEGARFDVADGLAVDRPLDLAIVMLLGLCALRPAGVGERS